MKKIYFVFLILLLGFGLVFFFSSKKLSNPVYRYFDGSGNQFVVTKNSVEYIPISKEFSSSGVYSGGETVKKSISFDEFEKIRDLFNEAFLDTSHQIQNHEMMSGSLEIQKGNKKQSVILDSNASSKKEIENILNQIQSQK